MHRDRPPPEHHPERQQDNGGQGGPGARGGLAHAAHGEQEFLLHATETINHTIFFIAHLTQNENKKVVKCNIYM